ncbi:hypothetical protein TNCV_2747181 [Trichonephila clavipes]|nr:hypothetical protein TNCV_2747181 [Trichonephila clavipes]
MSYVKPSLPTFNHWEQDWEAFLFFELGKVLALVVTPCACASDDEFIMMEGSALPHTHGFVNGYLEDQGLKRNDG